MNNQKAELSPSHLLTSSPSVSPTVSVIMNCLNGEKYLREAIDSVYAQTYKDWEIIFWDNASTDNSANIAKNYDNRLRYFHGENTVPLYAARNMALRHADGEYIAILDCDDMWFPTKLEEQIPLFARDPEVGLVFSDSIIFNEKGRQKCYFQIVKPARGYVFQKLLVCNFVPLPTVLIRRDSLNGLECLFDGRLTMIGDYDAWLKIGHKWKIDYLAKPLAKYRVHRNNITSTNGRRLIAYECDLVIENLKRHIPDVETVYNKEIKQIKRRGDVYSALLDWEKDDRKKARMLVRRYIRNSVVHFALYILMYFPYRYVFKPFYAIYNKNITPD